MWTWSPSCLSLELKFTSKAKDYFDPDILGWDMAIPEVQLATWSHIGSIHQSSSTYQSIKGVLEHADAPYRQRAIDCFLQGSYGNDTNIFGDSDVDIVLRTRELFHYNIDALAEPQKAEFKRVHPDPAPYTLKDLRKDVVAWLERKYGADLDTSGSKALKLRASENRRSSDILLVAPHKHYSWFQGSRTEDQSFREGVLFFCSDGTTVVNYPKQHSENLTANHQASNNWLKPTVRIYKNMRKQMVERGIIKAGTAPSYFLEGILSNVEPNHFGKDWSSTIENTYNWIATHEPSGYVCTNRIHPLIRDNTPTSWPLKLYADWLSGMKTLWNSW